MNRRIYNAAKSALIASILASGVAAQVETAQRRVDIAPATYRIAAAASANAVRPTDVYRIGEGDVLYVSLGNARSGGYYTVMHDGTIDFPLAAEPVAAETLTLDQLEKSLESKVKLFDDVRVQVRVRSYGSHKVRVSGLVQRSGDIFLTREA